MAVGETGYGLCHGGPNLCGMPLLRFYCSGDFSEWLLSQGEGKKGTNVAPANAVVGIEARIERRRTNNIVAKVVTDLIHYLSLFFVPVRSVVSTLTHIAQPCIPTMAKRNTL